MQEDLLIRDIFKKGTRVAIRGATWEFKGIEKEIFASQFEYNPIKAERDLGANPPETSGGALPNPDIIDALANYDRPDPVDKKLNIYGWSIPPIFDWFEGDARYRYYMHFDLSKSGDQTGAAMCHYDYDRGVYVLDLIMTIPVSKNWNLKFQSIENIVDFLVLQKFPIAKVTFDGFQSLNIIQSMEKRGILSQIYSVDRGTEAYDTLIQTLLQKRLDYYPQKTFIKEVKEIQLVGNKYNHPPNGSKDTSDAGAGALANCAKDTLKTEFKHRDLTSMFNLDYNLKDHFTYEDEDGLFRWVDMPFTNDMKHSIYINGLDSELIVVHGYSLKEQFIIDFADIISIVDDSDIVYLLHLISNFRAEFVSAGIETSFKVIDTLRKQRIRIVSSDMNLMDSARSRGVRVIRSQGRDAVSMFISQVKQDNVRIVKEQRLFADISEINLTNYADKPLGFAVSMWLHYMLQDAKKVTAQAPRPILSGSGLGNSTGSSGGFKNTIGKRPKPRLR